MCWNDNKQVQSCGCAAFNVIHAPSHSASSLSANQTQMVTGFFGCESDITLQRSYLHTWSINITLIQLQPHYESAQNTHSHTRHAESKFPIHVKSGLGI